MSDIVWMTLEEVGRAIRQRTVSAVDVTTACLERIERYDARTRAFITVTADEALAAARRADAVARDGSPGPLAGVPIALKDLFDTAGVRTTAGSRIFADRVPRDDAFVAARLRAAGAVFIGKTNLHEWAFGVTNQNPHFGAARNPWNDRRIPGGSSGGSAIALALGECFGTLGSDTGGSIRIPSSLCGVVGLKPTYGRVSLRGAVPLSWTLDHAGPMARTVRDAAILYAAISGYDALDPASIDAPADDPLARIEDGVRGIRIGVPTSHFFERADPDVAALVKAAVAALEADGAVVHDVPFPESQSLLETQRTILSTDAAAFHSDRLRDRTGEFGDDVLARLRAGQSFTGAQYATARRTREELRRAITSLFADVDVIATPTTAIAAPLAEDADPREQRAEASATPSAVAEAARLTALTSPFNLTGLPAVSVPCGFTSAGLPVGLQIAAAPWREATALRVARAYERATGWSARRPAMATESAAATTATA